MYTARLLSDVKNTELRRRIINVEFTDGPNTFNKEFGFKIDEIPEVMKRTVKQYLDELNFVPAEITDLDYVEPTEPTKTAAELEKEEWDKDRAQLATVMSLVRDGVFTGTEKQITDLQAKVKAGFKTSYLN